MLISVSYYNTMELLIPEDVLRIMHVLRENGHECYIVGGAVRSALLGLPVHDYDLTTDAMPERMQEVFASFKTIPTGLKHGTLTVLSGVRPIEITTYRTDGDYTDHRHPASVKFSSSVQQDCARRDFTVNALCYAEETGILDFFGGIEDLNSHILRAIGIPEERFDEDALRILRALRFSARLNFTIEEKTASALHAKKDLLAFISAERIREEINGLFDAQSGPCIMKQYRDIFEVFLPEIKTMTDQQWQKMTDEMYRCPASYITRMASLLHMITDSPKTILQRLKYSNEEIRRITALIASVDMPVHNRTDIRRIRGLLEEQTVDALAMRKAADPACDIETAQRLYQEILDQNLCCSLKELAVNGKDMLEAGLKGPDVRKALQVCLEEVITDRMPNEKEALMNFVHQSFF